MLLSFVWTALMLFYVAFSMYQSLNDSSLPDFFHCASYNALFSCKRAFCFANPSSIIYCGIVGKESPNACCLDVDTLGAGFFGFKDFKIKYAPTTTATPSA